MNILKLKSRGEGVKRLQSRLNALGWRPLLLIDGDFGKDTHDALCWVQGKLGLVVDGKYGPQSTTAFRRALDSTKAARPEPDKSAMNQIIRATPFANDNAAPPQNVAALKLLDTSRTINEVVVHCAATPEGKHFTVADIRAWHKKRGWSDIGYHYVVYLDGSIQLGRPIGQIGAHVEGHNTGTIGIVYVGGVSSDGKTAKDTRTPAQRASLLWLTGQLINKHRGIRKVSGHNQYANKACPSFTVQEDALGKLAA